MANIVNQRILNEGTRWAIVQWYLESDGNEGELVDRVILDPVNDFIVPVPQQFDDKGKLLPPEMTIRTIWASTAWFDMKIGFQGQAGNDYRIVVARDAHTPYDFTKFGGIRDKTPYENLPTGCIVLSTRDFAPLGSIGYLVMEIRKD